MTQECNYRAEYVYIQIQQTRFAGSNTVIHTLQWRLRGKKKLLVTTPFIAGTADADKYCDKELICQIKLSISPCFPSISLYKMQLILNLLFFLRDMRNIDHPSFILTLNKCNICSFSILQAQKYAQENRNCHQ